MQIYGELDPKAPEFKPQNKIVVEFNADAAEFKPPQDLGQLRPEAAEFIPAEHMSGNSWATERLFSSLASQTEAFQNNRKRQMPHATDEEWRIRIQKREKEVETIKSLQSYRLYIEVFPHDKRGEDDPNTPDPRDRTVSKRMWKWNVEKWRLQLKSKYVYSTAFLLQVRYALKKLDVRNAVAAEAAAHLSGKPNETEKVLPSERPTCWAMNIPAGSAAHAGSQQADPAKVGSDANEPRPNKVTSSRTFGAGTWQ